MKKLLLTTVVTSVLSFNVYASNQSDQINQMITNMNNIKENINGISTKLTVDSLNISMITFVDSIFNYAETLTQPNVSEDIIENEKNKVRQMLVNVNQNWKLYKELKDPKKVIYLAETEYTEEFIEKLLVTAKVI